MRKQKRSKFGKRKKEGNELGSNIKITEMSRFGIHSIKFKAKQIRLKKLELEKTSIQAREAKLGFRKLTIVW